MPEQPAASPELVVVGAGVMGSWTALRAVERGLSTLLVDAFGPGDPRATSGDETRIIRSSHGTDAFYASWARSAREAWIDLGERSGSPIFEPTGVAWFAHREDGFEAESESTLRALGIPVEHVPGDAVSSRWPGASGEHLAFALFEPEAGALRARHGVRAVAGAFEAAGGRLRIDAVTPGRITGRRLENVTTASGEAISGGTFVFAAGPWLTRLFPELFADLIAVTKQDVLYFGPAGGDRRFDAGRFPAWVDFDEAMYGIPCIDGRGFKAAPDAYGRRFDPDAEDRIIDRDTVARTRAFLGRRMPDLARRPITETRVCQYETTPDTHFVIDRHPDFDNVWLVGGGSGHAFKHGPMIGGYVVDRLEDEGGRREPGPEDPPDDRFALDRSRAAGPTLRSGANLPTH